MKSLLQTTIGIEIHAELNTATKMFSPAANRYGAPTNTLIHPIDLGLPGTMPQPNEQAIALALKLAKSLGMIIDTKVRFDRKHYIYPDLPKGYQITQFFHPIGKSGMIETPEGKVYIERIHLEEDTAKANLIGNKKYLDFNRAGVPLIEIVTHPMMHSAEQAVSYVREIRNVLLINGISDAKMEQGSMRCDVSISVAPFNSVKLNPRTEVKNLNSFERITAAINYEINRQTQLVLSGKELREETRRWNTKTNQTEFMRWKDSSQDYHYLPENNISPIYLNEDFVTRNITNLPIQPSMVRENLILAGLKNSDVELLVANPTIFSTYEKVLATVKNPIMAANWVVNELSKFSFEPTDERQLKQILKILNLLSKEELNGKQAKTLVEFVFENADFNAVEYIEKNNFKQIKDPVLIKSILQDVLTKMPNIGETYKLNPVKALKSVIGLMMVNSGGKINPVIANEIVTSELEKLV